MIDPLAGLNDAQRQAVENIDGPVLVLAGAGSGKTRVLAHRIAHIVQSGAAKPWQILAVTFTNKAARELRERVSAITPGGDKVAAGTFHSIMLRMLRQEAEALGFTKEFSILDTKDSERLIKQILEEFHEENFKPRAIHSAISKLKNDMVSFDDASKVATTPIEKVAANVYKVYQERMRLLSGMDFDDLLLRPLELFKKYPAILAKWSSKWKYLHIDEYQDTNHTQFELIRVLGGPKPNLCVVGDDDQSIYGWRGARVENVFRFKDSFEGAQVFRLEQNYRSTQKILDLAHAVVSKSSQREEKKLWTDNKGGDLPKAYGIVSDFEEARQVADIIGKGVLSGKRAFRDYAILYRTNAQSQLFEEMMRGRRYPAQIVGSVGFFDRKEVRDVVGYFKLCLNPKDDLALRRIISEPPRGIGASTIDKLQEYCNEKQMVLFEAMRDIESIAVLNARAKSACKKFVEQVESWRATIDSEDETIDEWAERVLKESGYMKRLSEGTTLEVQGRIENIESLISSIARAGEDGKTLAEFMEESALATDQDKYDDNSDTIKLMTIHAAKGLEFPAVFVVGLENGMFPMQRGDDPADLDEERRLFYVAVTRAREELYLTYAKRRRVWGIMQDRVASRFLKDSPEEMVEWEMGSPFNDSAFAGDNGTTDSFTRKFKAVEKPLEMKPSERFAGGNTGRKTKSPTAKRPASSPIRPVKKPLPIASKRNDISVEDIPAIRPGDLVEHPRFGKGIVIKTTKFRGDIKVSVEFDDAGVVHLMQKIARLQPLKDFRK